MSTGVTFKSTVLSEDVDYYARLGLMGLGLLSILDQVIRLGFGFYNGSIKYTIPWKATWLARNPPKQIHGWKTIRWYELERTPQDDIDFTFKLSFAIILILVPGLSFMSEFTRLSNGADGDDLWICFAHMMLAFMLVLDLAAFIMSSFNEPIHTSIVIASLYLSLRFDNLHYLGWFAAFGPAVVKAAIEVMYGYYFLDYFDFIPGLISARTVYRFCYVAAVWAGVVAVVAWLIGWYGEWIDMDVENGSIVEPLLEMMRTLEDGIRNFLRNFENIVNRLSICGSLPVDETLLLDVADDWDANDYADGMLLTGSTLGVLYTSAGPRFYSEEKTNSDNVLRNPPSATDTKYREVRQCCFCVDSNRDFFNTRYNQQLGTNDPMQLCEGGSAYNSFEDGTGACAPQRVAGNSFSYNASFDEWIRFNALNKCGPREPFCQTPVDMDHFDEEIAKHSNPDQCKTEFDREECDEGEDCDIDQKGVSTLRTEAERTQKDVDFDQSGLDATKWPPSDLPDGYDDNQWVDPVHEKMKSHQQEMCEDIACGAIIAVMAAATAASFIPFIGGAISFSVKTLGKIAWQLFKLIRKYAKQFLRFNRRRRQFRTKRRLLAKLINGAKTASSLGIKATQNLIYPFVPLFLVGFFAVFVGFWKRTDVGNLRGSFAGLLLGLLVANIIVMVLVRYIPIIANELANALPSTLLKIKFHTKDGWKWMEYASYASTISCLFWFVALLMNLLSDVYNFVIGDDDDDEETNESPKETRAPKKEEVELTEIKMELKEPQLRVPRWRRKSNAFIRGNPFVDRFNDAFTRDDNMSSTAWVSNLLWIVPAGLIALIALMNNEQVFNASATIQSNIFGAASDLEGEKGGQEYSMELKDSSEGKLNICELVGQSVKIIVDAAARAVGSVIMESIDLIKNWYDLAFHYLETFISELVDLPNLDLVGDSNQIILFVVYGCPIAAFMIALFGVFTSLLPRRVSLVIRLGGLLDLDLLHTFLYFLGFTGLTVSLSIYGIAAVITSLKVPFFTIQLETTSVIINSVVCNILVLVSFANHTFNRIVPFYAPK